MDERPRDSAAETPQTVTFDAIMPASIAMRVEASGVQRASLDPLTLFVLSILGGAFVAFGAVFATTVSAGSVLAVGPDGGTAFSASLPYGIVRLLAGLAFTTGLILIVIGGAELFTGTNLIVIAWASGKVRTRDVALHWMLAFSGNFVGAFLTAVLMFQTTQYTFGAGAVGLTALATANAKVALPFIPAVALGIMCNALVCLAVWMCFAGRTIVDKVLASVPPIAAFAAAGFEHCIANIYFIPMGLFIKSGAPESFWAAIGKTAADFPALTWRNFLIGNLLPVTIGNLIGGTVMVAAVYWFVYLRKREHQEAPS